MVKKNISKKKVTLGVGLGLAAAAAAGAGYFFYGSKNASKNRLKASQWSKKLHADVLSKAKKLKKLDEKALRIIVDESTRTYNKVKSINKADLQSAAQELKSNWKNISTEIQRVAKKETKVVKKAAKSAVVKAKKVVSKKSVKKTSKQK